MSKTMAMRLVYVASPYAALRCREEDRNYLARKIAVKECKRVIKAGYIPISPVLMFSELFDEKTQRQEVIKAGLELLRGCAYVYFSLHPDARFSEGMKKEREYARELGTTELDFNLNPTLGL